MKASLTYVCLETKRHHKYLDTLGQSENFHFGISRQEAVSAVEDDGGEDNDLNDASHEDSITHNYLELVDDEIV